MFHEYKLGFGRFFVRIYRYSFFLPTYLRFLYAMNAKAPVSIAMKLIKIHVAPYMFKKIYCIRRV